MWIDNPPDASRIQSNSSSPTVSIYIETAGEMVGVRITAPAYLLLLAYTKNWLLKHDLCPKSLTSAYLSNQWTYADSNGGPHRCQR
jgi:hypothetical protein